MDYSPLFAPLQIGRKLTLPNRLVMAPMTTTAGEPDGRFSPEEIAYLARRAHGGIGLIITPACYVHKSGHAFDRQVGCDSDTMLPRLEECARAINATGSVSFLQIHHGGNAARQEHSGQPPLAPSAVLNRRGTSEMPQPMSEAEIAQAIEAFAKAASRARAAGFSGVEIHGANTYLFQQFFSPYTNRRTDRWSAGEWANRIRFSSEVVRAIRREVGDDYPLAYRISPEEPDPDGYSTDEAIALLKELIAIGIDIVHVSSWEYGAGVRNDYPPGSHPTKMIRDALPGTVPVIGVGGVLHPDQALRVREDGVDLVALGRVLLIDAGWGNKVREGRAEEIRTSVSSRGEIERLDLPELMKPYAARFFLPD